MGNVAESIIRWSMPKLSIIIPAFNVEAFLPQCLDSIFSQKVVDVEVLCVDDGSTDGTPRLLQDYAEDHPNLRVLTQPNQGMSTARNLGLKEAKGEYVLFVDSDDWLCEGSLAQLSASLNGEDVVCFNAKKYLEKTSEFKDNELLSVDGVVKGWDYFNKARLIPSEIHFVCIWQRAYRRAFLEENNLCFAEGIRRAEDDLFTTMVMYHAQTLKVVNECVYVYRVRDNSITTTVDINRWYDSLKVQEIMADFFIPLKGVDKSAIYQVLASSYINQFTSKTQALYGNHDKELLERIKWDNFKEVCVTSRHKRLCWLIRMSPKLFRLYESMTKII